MQQVGGPFHARSPIHDLMESGILQIFVNKMKWAPSVPPKMAKICIKLAKNGQKWHKMTTFGHKMVSTRDQNTSCNT